jgi:hypothetical protein
MTERKKYLLRLPQDLLDELRSWAGHELRSLNGQIEFILREAVRKRKSEPREEPVEGDGESTS